MTAIAAPAYCEMPEMANNASGEAVRANAEGDRNDACESVEKIGIGATDFLPQRLEAVPTGEREARLP